MLMITKDRLQFCILYSYKGSHVGKKQRGYKVLIYINKNKLKKNWFEKILCKFLLKE